MKIEDHYKRLKESLAVIEESIEKGLVERQRTIGFSASAASTDMLEIMLHKNSLIDPGFILKHEWFKAKGILNEKLGFDFPKKQQILELMSKIEEKRNVLCYGKPKTEGIVREVIENLNRLKAIFREEGINEI